MGKVIGLHTQKEITNQYELDGYKDWALYVTNFIKESSELKKRMGFYDLKPNAKVYNLDDYRTKFKKGA